MTVFPARQPSSRALVVLLAIGVMVAIFVNPAARANAAPANALIAVGFECSCSGAEASSIAIQAQILKGWASYENANGRNPWASGQAGHHG